MIRPINRHDLGDILELYSELMPYQSVSVQTIAPILDHYLTDDNYEMFCHESDRMDGLVTVSKRWTFFHQGRCAIIEDLIVKESLQGKGIRQELIGFVELRMKEQGILNFELATEKHGTKNQQFWEALQYRPLGVQFRKQFK